MSHQLFCFSRHFQMAEHLLVISSEMDNTACEKGSLDLLKEKPEELLLFVDKYVCVQLIKNTTFKGFLDSIDPISHSIILLVPKEDTYNSVLIPGHALIDIKESDDIVDKRPVPRGSLEPLEVDSAKKAQLLGWLKFNLLPVTEDGDEISFGNASLLPPYSVADICTDNPMVAMQMRKIIEAMPQDFEVPKS